MNTCFAFLGGSMGAGEILVVLVVALLLFGAKRLPSIARSIGQALEELRRAARGVNKEILSADLETPAAGEGDFDRHSFDSKPGPEGSGADFTEREYADAAPAAPTAAPENPQENAPAAAETETQSDSGTAGAGSSDTRAG